MTWTFLGIDSTSPRPVSSYRSILRLVILTMVFITVTNTSGLVV